MREARLERCAGRLCPRRVCAKSDDAVVHFKEFVWCSVPVLKVSEQTPEEATERVVQSEINVVVGKTFDDFPAHVAVDNLAVLAIGFISCALFSQQTQASPIQGKHQLRRFSPV